MAVHFAIILLLASLHYSYPLKIPSPLLVPSPPEIAKQPPSDEILFQVSEDDSDYYKPTILECEALGESPPRYHWIKNGKHFNWQQEDDRISQLPGRGTLVFIKMKDEDAGQYQCFAENEWGVAASNSVFLRKSYLDSFKNTVPISLDGIEGQPFKLNCQLPYSYPKSKHFWVFTNSAGAIKSINNSRITPGPGGNLWFSSLTPQDASDDFMYTCAASSATTYEYKMGNRIHLNVLPSNTPPSAIKHKPVLQYLSRRNEVALRKEVVELFCIYGGTPLPQTVWLKNGKRIKHDSHISIGNYGKSLIIKSVDFSDGGTYTCEVSNGVGEIESHSIDLDVFAIPYFTVEPKSVNASESETVEFHCEAVGFPESRIEWTYNGKPLSQAPANPRRKIQPNRVVIENIEKHDTGNYGCNASNTLGYSYKDVYLNVLAVAPEIIHSPEDVEVVCDKDVVLPCNVFGAPKPTIVWTLFGKELDGSRYKILEHGDLHINDVQFVDSGEYTCHAHNKFGSTDASARVIVKERTNIVDGPRNYESVAGNKAVFHCNVQWDASLDLEIIWLINGYPIDFEPGSRFIKGPDYSLTIENTNELDSGSYTCKAKTRLDEAIATASLTVKASTPRPLK